MASHHDEAHPATSFDDMDDILLSMDVGGKQPDHHPVLYEEPHRFDSPVVGHEEDDNSIQHMFHSPNSWQDWRLANAVHMEVQENAKLPTFHWNVDRTGSSHNNKLDLLPNYSAIPNHRKLRSGSIDELSLTGSQLDHLLLPEAPHLNIAEAFFNVESGRRHANFPTHSSGKYDAATHDVDPTPWSEIRHPKKKKKSQEEDSGDPPTLSLPNVIHVPYYSRTDPLPIPSPARKAKPLVAAVSETEPPIASVQDPLEKAIPDVEAILDPPPSTVPSLVPKPTAVRQTSGSARLDVARTQQHSVAHTVPRPALQNASLQQTQYGFGPKHVVPAVPPTKSRSSSRSSGTIRAPLATRVASATNNKNKQSSNPPGVVHSNPSSTGAPEDDDSGSGGGLTGNEAYERKKQRAKTARVRLNESIDRLQIALNIAGTQSKQRLTMFDEQTVAYRIITDCIQCSDDAKKWDRPSFVGSAATMIQGLNAQCEALVRALHDERHARAQCTASSTLSPTSRPKTVVMNGHTKDAPVRSPGGVKHRHSYGLFDATSMDISEEDVNVKRQRLNERSQTDDPPPAREVQNDIRHEGTLMESHGAIHTLESSSEPRILSEKSIMDRVASFLDPLSITRCMRVSRAWKNWSVFKDDSLWLHLVIERFGTYNTRQWCAKLNDEDQTVASSFLYKTMDSANVMPNFPKDGLLLLGEARITGKVSAWTYLVERSNGETMRSVRRHLNMPGIGAYASIPVVQLWTVIQNTGIHDDVVVIREQSLTVDTSTRRRGDEMIEIDWDDHMRKRILNLDGTVHLPHSSPDHSQSIYRELCRLRLFESVVIEANIHAKGCSTTSKFMQKSNFTKVLIQIRDRTTIPLVITFPRDALHFLPS